MLNATSACPDVPAERLPVDLHIPAETIAIAVMSTMSSSTLANAGIRLCRPLIRMIFAPAVRPLFSACLRGL